MRLIAHGYETRVKVFMLLVVLFLVTANLITVTFLSRSEDLLREEAGARVLAATLSLGREIETEGVLPAILAGAPGAAAEAGGRLARFGAAQGASYVDLLDGAGGIVASSQTWRAGSRDGSSPTLDEASRASLLAGRAVLVEPEDGSDLTLAVAPLIERTSGATWSVRAGYALPATGTITRQIRLLTWAQALGGAAVLAMVLAFTRFVLQPYRELRATAARLEPEGASGTGADDPAFLVASFRGVVDKMKSLEGELERMKPGIASPGSQDTFLSNLSSGVLILDPAGTIVTVNPAGETILGMRAGELIGRKAADLFEASSELVDLLEDAVRHGHGRSREVVPYRLPRGRIAHLGVTVSSPPGGGAGALCLFSDLTEIRGVQEKVLLKENLARLGELSAGIAHEFRNSLATILGYARLSAKEEGEAGNSSAIIREVQSLGRVVDEFLRYAGPARLQRTPIDLRSMVEGLAREAVRDGERVRVKIEGEWPVRIEGDETLLRQALNNLIRNAVEASVSDGTEGNVVVKGRRDGGSASVEIVDSGPGFAPEVLSRLFTPFVTTKSRGTGLGMALAQKIVVSHDGTLEAVNAEGGGARVTMTLPAG